MTLDWKEVPKQALVTALRNCMLGPTNLSRQNKRDLIAIAERAWATLDEPRREALAQGIANETRYVREKVASHAG